MKLSRFNGRFATESLSQTGFVSPFRFSAKPYSSETAWGNGTLISDVSGPRHSTDAHRGGARCVQNGSALVPKNPLNQLEAVHFFATGRDFYLLEGLGKNNQVALCGLAGWGGITLMPLIFPA
jgi:hypothetical protein